MHGHAGSTSMADAYDEDPECDAVHGNVAVRRCRGGSGLCQLRHAGRFFEKLEKLKIDVRGKIRAGAYGAKFPRW